MPTLRDKLRAWSARLRAEAYDAAQRRPEAFAAYREAAQVWETVDPILAGSLWTQAARQAAFLEDRPAQLEASRRALALLPPWPRWTTALTREDGMLALRLCAEALYWLDRLTEAETVGRDAIAAAETFGGPEHLTAAYGTYAQALLRQGRPVETLGAVNRALDAARRTAEPAIIASALGDRAIALLGLGQYTDALRDLTEANELLEKVADQAMADRVRLATLGTEASIHRTTGNLAEAVTLAEQSMELCARYGNREQYLQARMVWGLALAESGEPDRGRDAIREVYRETLARGTRHLAGRAANNLAVVDARAGRLVRAGAWARRAVRLQDTGDLDARGGALCNLGILAMVIGDLTCAQAALTEAIDDWETVRREVVDDRQYIAVLEDQARAYRALQQCRLAVGDVDGGLEAAERARGRGLLRRLRTRAPELGNPLAAAFTTAAAVALAAERNAGFLVYSLVSRMTEEGEDDPVAGLYAWYVDATGVAYAKVGVNVAKALLQGEVRPTDPFLGLTRDLLVPEFTDRADAAGYVEPLSQLLVWPLTEALRRSPAELLVIVPDGELDRIPFAALRTRSGEQLVDRWPVTVVPAIALFAELDGRAAPTTPATRVLAVGNPAPPQAPIAPGLPVPNLPPLRHAEREARRIAADHGGSALIGAAATRAAVLSALTECEIAHFATHGRFGSDDGGTPGALCLSPSGDDDGYLRADDIATLDLSRCRVVLLSACQTGWGRSAHEGSLGLARAFLHAGVRAVVVSLWPVDDAATADLMIALHGFLRAGDSVGQALRRAMRQARDAGTPLQHWASFTVVGDGRLVPVPPCRNRLRQADPGPGS